MLTKAVTGEGLFQEKKKKVCLYLKILCEEQQRTDPLKFSCVRCFVEVTSTAKNDAPVLAVKW